MFGTLGVLRQGTVFGIIFTLLACSFFRVNKDFLVSPTYCNEQSIYVML